MVHGLWRETFGNISEQRFNWLYRDSLGSGGQCWLATTESGIPVGTVGLVYRDIRISSEVVRCAQAVDLVVDRGHRTGAAAVKLLRHLVAEADSAGCRLIYTFPLHQARPVALRIGFKPLSTLTRWAMPLSSRYKLQSRLPAALSALFAPIFDVGLRALSGDFLFRLPNNYRTTTLSEFDERFDELWRDAPTRAQHVGDRQAGYLQWRFRKIPSDGYQIFGLLDLQGNLRAYIVYRKTGQQVSISDFLFDDLETLQLSFRALAKQMRNEGMAALSMQCLLPDFVAAALRRVGFFQRLEEAQVLIYRSPRLNREALDSTPENSDWFLTEADRDV